MDVSYHGIGPVSADGDKTFKKYFIFEDPAGLAIAQVICTLVVSLLLSYNLLSALIHFNALSSIILVNFYTVLLLSVVLLGFRSVRLMARGSPAAPEYPTSMIGKTVVVTGGTKGIGRKAVERLAGWGARVVMTARDVSEGEKIVEEVRKTTGGFAIGGCVEVVECHFDDLESVRRCVSQIHRKDVTQIDVVLLNAGVMRTPFELTKQGIEMQFAVNHVGQFFLVQNLMPLISRAGGRVVVVSSMGHYRAPSFPLDEILANYPSGYDPRVAYVHSKTANILFTKYLNKKIQEENPACRAYTCHPGLVSTDIFRSGFSAQSLIVKFVRLISKSSLDGAATPLMLCATPGALLTGGAYYSEGQEAVPHPKTLDEEMQEKLWNASIKLMDNASSCSN